MTVTICLSKPKNNLSTQQTKEENSNTTIITKIVATNGKHGGKTM